MPELAELRLTADFVNTVSKDEVFCFVDKNPTHKCESVTTPYEYFFVDAESRGKEMLLFLRDALNPETNYVTIRFSMGMSGRFKWTETGKEAKHAHLKFLTTNGYTLSFVDDRRFGKWKFGEGWSDNRGPDPTLEFQEFIRNIKSNLIKKDFDKPICEVLMNQKYFNGIGNYLRAEILYRADINPFESARVALSACPEIYRLCKWAPRQAYKLGGGQLRDWENPYGFNSDPDSWNSFMLCYNNPSMSKVVDSNGRTFWFNPKWNIHLKNN